MSFPRYPSYKELSAPGHPLLPSHWELKPVKSVASHNDDVLEEDAEPDFEILYVDISGVSADRGIVEKLPMRFEHAPSRARRRVRHGDVIISTVRTYLKAIARIQNPEENLVVSTGFAVVRPRSGLEPEFLAHALSSSTFLEAVISRSTGVSYPAINASELVSLPIPVPPIEEQRAIARFLDRETAKIDALVAEQERLIELLKEKRQAVISHAVTKGLNPNAPMKDSGIEWLGSIPAHWSIKRLKNLSPFITVGIVVEPTSYVSDSGLPFIYGGDIREGVIDHENARRISREASAANEKTLLRAGDLLTVRVGAPGVTAVVPKECEGGNCASVMLVRRGAFNSDWLALVMNTRVVRFQVEVVQYGAAQEQFNISHAINFWVPTPPREEQDEIARQLHSQVSRIDELMEAATRSMDLLRERRAALISAAVTGQIDVRPEALKTAA